MPNPPKNYKKSEFFFGDRGFKVVRDIRDLKDFWDIRVFKDLILKRAV